MDPADPGHPAVCRRQPRADRRSQSVLLFFPILLSLPFYRPRRAALRQKPKCGRLTELPPDAGRERERRSSRADTAGHAGLFLTIILPYLPAAHAVRTVRERIACIRR